MQTARPGHSVGNFVCFRFLVMYHTLAPGIASTFVLCFLAMYHTLDTGRPKV